MPITTEFAELIHFSNTLADTARGIVKTYFRQPVAVERKADDSPVTIADREAESALRNMILGQFISG